MPRRTRPIPPSCPRCRSSRRDLVRHGRPGRGAGLLGEDATPSSRRSTRLPGRWLASRPLSPIRSRSTASRRPRRAPPSSSPPGDGGHHPHVERYRDLARREAQHRRPGLGSWWTPRPSHRRSSCCSTRVDDDDDHVRDVHEFFGLRQGTTWAPASTAVASHIVVPRCAPGKGQTQTDAFTTALSTMVVSAATDPVQSMTFTATGWAGGFDTRTRELMLGEEVAPCAQLPAVTPAGVSQAISRSWSNAAAAAYHDPCLPAAARTTWPYRSPPTASPSTASPRRRARARRHEEDLRRAALSDGPTGGPWNLKAFSTTGSSSFTYALDANTGSNGDVLHHDHRASHGVHRRGPAHPGSERGTEVVLGRSCRRSSCGSRQASDPGRPAEVDCALDAAVPGDRLHSNT